MRDLVQLYFDLYEKSEEDFFGCLDNNFNIKIENREWIKILEDLLDNWERLSANKANLSEELLGHPFFVFANVFALYMEEKTELKNKAITLAGMERIAMLVLENATKVLLEELRIFKQERKDITDSDECYRQYCSSLKQKEIVRKLIYKYPLMFRIIIEQSNKIVYFYQWVEENYVKDYKELRNRFNISGQLLKIENNIGDSHRGKQQVLIFHFENGKILFKPRNLCVDEKFTLVINYVNSQLGSDLKYARVYNCGQYGWQEFITSKSCNLVDEVKTYYYKLGIFAGIFNLLMASDMHGKLVLNNISLSIKKGEFIGIVGETASGKSTLAMILMGLEKVTEGKIFYDGIEINDINKRVLRKQIGVVSQNSYFFKQSIKENLIFGNNDISMAEIELACKRAAIWDEIRAMPMQLETILSEEALNISGGQRQRLALARAIINRPEVLIVDEGTSALDNITEQVVQKSLKSMECTRVVIAHRLGTIIDADKIVVMKNGEIQGVGNHKELMEHNSYYKKLYKKNILESKNKA